MLISGFIYSNMKCSRKAMEFFRGSDDPEVNEEANAIIENATLSKGKDRCINSGLGQLTTYAFWKPFSCIGILYWCYNICGYGVVSAYSNDYFENAGARAVSYEKASVILGFVKWILTFFTPFILVAFSKKRIFVTCGFVSSLGFILGDHLLLMFSDKSCYSSGIYIHF